MKVRVIQQGDQTFTYDGEDEASIRQALLHEPGVPGIVYDITDPDRSDMDAGEYLIATEDDGTPVWAGWLGGVTGPPPLSALTVTPAGYQGPAQHTYTAGCAGFHKPGPCPAAFAMPPKWAPTDWSVMLGRLDALAVSWDEIAAGSDAAGREMTPGTTGLPEALVGRSSGIAECARQLRAVIGQPPGPPAAQPPNPEPDGTIVIGPGAFASADRAVISWLGENYYRQDGQPS